MGNIMNLMQIIGMARQNPQQAVMNILQQGFQNGSNMIIQQMLNSGMVTQGQYESARQDAGMFTKK